MAWFDQACTSLDFFAGKKKFNAGGMSDNKGYNPTNLPVNAKKIKIANDNTMLIEAIISLPLPNNLAIITEPIIIKT